MINFSINVPFATSSVDWGIERPGINCVGERVKFVINSATGFNVPNAVHAAYVEAHHLVEHKWTFTPPSGEPSTWTVTDRQIEPFKNRLEAWGFEAFYTPRVPGTYTVTKESRDGYGNSHIESRTFDVSSVDALGIPASRTYVLYDGVTDPTTQGAPAHDVANRFTDFAACVAAASTPASPCRIAVQSGVTLTNQAGGFLHGGLRLSEQVIINQYGGNGQTVLDFTTDNRMLLIRDSWNGSLVIDGDFLLRRDTPWRMDGINPSRGGNTIGICLRFFAGVTTNVSLTDVTFDGWFNHIGTEGFLSNPRISAENVDFRDYCNFSIFMGPNGTGQLMMRGCRHDAPPQVFAGGIRYQDVEAMTHWENVHTVRTSTDIIMDGCQFYQAHGWSWTSQDWQSHQSIRTDHNAQGGLNFNFTRNLFEGTGIKLTGTSGQAANNMLIERNIFLTGTQSLGFSERDLLHSGITFRNNIFLGSSAARDPGTDQYDLGLTVATRDADPQRISFNTFYDIRSGAYDASHIGVDLGGLQTETVQGESNIVHAPNYTAPITPAQAMQALAYSVTPQNTIGSHLGYVQIEWTEDLTLNQVSAAIAWPSDVDGLPVDASTFSGGSGQHYITQRLSSQVSPPYWNVTLIDNGNGTFSIRNDGLRAGAGTGDLVISGVQHYLRLDRRHDPIPRPNSATPVGDGVLVAPVQNIPMAAGSIMPAPAWDFFGNRRTGNACQGAVQV